MLLTCSRIHIYVCSCSLVAAQLTIAVYTMTTIWTSAILITQLQQDTISLLKINNLVYRIKRKDNKYDGVIIMLN